MNQNEIQTRRNEWCTLTHALNELQSEISTLTGSVGPTGMAGATGSIGPTGVGISSIDSGVARLYNGSATVSSPNVSTSSNIQATYIQPLTNPGVLSIANVTTGQFQISSTSSTDQSFVQWTATPYQNIVVLTTTLTTPFPLQFQASGNVLSSGASSITERGIVWSSTNPLPTISDSKVVATLGAGTGTFSVSWSTTNVIFAYVRAYAMNGQSVSYGNVMTGTTFICLARDTAITLDDGSTLPIQDITYAHRLLVWDFDVGRFASAHPLWIKKKEECQTYNLLTFSSGTTLKTINQHRIFNKEAGKFTYPASDDTPIGTHTFTSSGDETVLIKKDVVHEPVEYYNIITDYHLNLFADGILTSCRFNNMYPIRDMMFQKTRSWKRNNDVNQWSLHISPLYVSGLRLSEQVFPPHEIMSYIERLQLSRQHVILFLDHQGVMYLNDIHPDKELSGGFDKRCVSVLNDILDMIPQMEIVVSSDWTRWIGFDRIKEYYTEQGVKKQPIGFTKFIRQHPIEGAAKQRAEEIQGWIDTHRDEINQWIVFDDLDLSPHISTNFIPIDPRDGVTHDVLKYVQQLFHIL